MYKYRTVEGRKDDSEQKPQKLDVGMAVCRHDRIYKGYIHPYISLTVLPSLAYVYHETIGAAKICRDGVTCITSVCPIPCTLPSLYLQCSFCIFLALPSLHPSVHLESVSYLFAPFVLLSSVSLFLQVSFRC